MVESELKSLVHQYLIHKTDFGKKKDKMTEEQLRVFIDNAISDLCEKEEIVIPPDVRGQLIRDLVSAVVSLGPLRPFMEDTHVTEIMVNGPNAIYIQKNGKLEPTNVKFDSSQHLSHTVQKLLVASGSSRRVDESSPYVDFSLPDGSRVNVILPPCSLVGPVITIRKFSTFINTVDDLLELQMLDKKMAALLVVAMKAKLNIVFCGATGTGKTTTLNVFSRHIPEDERVITIEDTPELRLMQKHVVSLQTKTANIEGRGEITLRDLFVNSLRMRPDRIIIGEVRSVEMLDLIQSISSGHSGSLAIVHADTPQDAFNRMVTMMLMSGIHLSTEEIRRQVARAMDLLIHIELYPDGVRRINNITDVIYVPEGEQIIFHDIFAFAQDRVAEDGKILGHWEMNTKKPSFYPKIVKRNIKLPDGFFAA